MKISGFQKLTLLDYPGNMACTVFTSGCNFRCPFCHNASLVTHTEDCAVYTEEEIFAYLEKRKSLLDGVCITGGEPLLQPDIEDFMVKINSLGYKVKLDTNGSFPERLISAVNKGLVDYIAMDIKNSEEKYMQAAGCKDADIVEKIKRSVDFIINCGVDYEFRTTVVKELHTIEDIKNIGKIIKGAKKYFIQQFIDSGDLICGGLSPLDTEVLVQMKQFSESFVEKAEIRGVDTTSCDNA